MKLKLNKNLEVIYNGLRFKLQKGENKVEKGLGEYVKEYYGEFLVEEKGKRGEKQKK